MKSYFLLPVFVGLYLLGNAQTDISGVINEYALVTGVSSSCDCPATECATVTVTAMSGFSVGDRVLLIQMKGAIADTTNTPAHGSIIDIADAGNYEFANIHDITGNDITFEYPLSETYFTNASPADSACVQLIRVPVYNGDVNVTGTLEAEPWNGTTGGVLALEVEGTLTLQADISVDGQGFKGARRLATPTSCTKDTAFYYQSTHFQYTSCTSCDYLYDDNPVRFSENANYGGCGGMCETNRMMTNDNDMSSYRGEGIVANTFKKRNLTVNSNGETEAIFDKGKGRWGNGGGGGGNHNAGGGGGGNYGPGGFGGNVYNELNNGNGPGCWSELLGSRRGYGGASLSPGSAKIFMGGGGGEGHDNGGNGSTGTNGGGIIMIQAQSIANAGSHTISANGLDNNVIAAGDGSGGGGAGGSILIEAENYTDPVTIEANGGQGGDHDNDNCHGTGGGGGGGLVWLSNSTQPANVTTTASAGMNGIQLASGNDCDPDTNWGATPGFAGGETFGGGSPFFNTSPCAPGILLPVELVTFTAQPYKGKVQLQWTTEMERNNDHFTIERSADGSSFTKIATIQSKDNQERSSQYTTVDQHPYDGVNYYRLSQTDYDGKKKYLRMIKVTVEVPQILLDISPNPATDHLYVDISSPREQPMSLMVYDTYGRRVIHQELHLHKQKNEILLDISDLPQGWYAIKLSSDDGQTQLAKKFIKK